MEEKRNKSQPFMLMKNVIYSTYQLHAFSSNQQTPSLDSFKIIILEIMGWLRERFRELDIPEEIKTPEPSKYKEFSLDEIKSFRIDSGYGLEVCYIEKEKRWAMQLMEPDMGPNRGEVEKRRLPAPGRLFFTNIGLVEKNNCVEIGINVQVSELENETSPCEVFRIGVVKRLVRNPLIGLKQEKYEILETIRDLDTLQGVTKLKSFIGSKERELPVVVFSDFKVQPKTSPPMEPEDIVINKKDTSWTLSPHSKSLDLLSRGKETFSATQDAIDRLSKDLMGYAYVFYLHKERFTDFVSSCESDMRQGDGCVCYPYRSGNRRTIYRSDDIWFSDNEALLNISKEVQEYPKRKSVDYGDVKFLNELKEIEAKEFLSGDQEIEELKAALIVIEKEYSEKIKVGVGEERDRHIQETISLNKEIEKLKKENEKLLGQKEKGEVSREELEKLQDDIRMLKDENEILRHDLHRLSAPKKPQDIPSWVKEHFSKTLIFHPKAVSLIEAVKESEVDMEILCDAITYLATEYWELLTGRITDVEMNSKCSKRYGRPFLVTPIKGGTIENFPMEYKIKYYKVGNKLRESPLDLHLKVGNDSENLLRIYFLYDKENKLVVVGSLPKHLKTLNNK